MGYEKLFIIIIYACVSGLALVFLIWLISRKKTQKRKKNEASVRMKWMQLDHKLINPIGCSDENIETTLDLPYVSNTISLTYVWKEKVVQKKFPLEACITIGRDAGNDICLDDPTVSKAHCEIHGAVDGRFSIFDLNSRNKTIVQRNSEKKVLNGNDTPFFVQSGDCLLLGTTDIWISIKSGS